MTAKFLLKKVKGGGGYKYVEHSCTQTFDAPLIRQFNSLSNLDDDHYDNDYEGG